MVQKKLFILLGITVLLTMVLAYAFLVPPRVTHTALVEAENGPIYIEVYFDKPIARQKITHEIDPVAYGNWTFENPMIGRHLYRKVVFTPAVLLKPETEYKVTIKHVSNVTQRGFEGKYEFKVTTKALPSSANPKTLSAKKPAPAAEKIFMIPVDFHWQEHPLSCEAASLKMALSAKGVSVLEHQVTGQIGYSTTEGRRDTWGDPYEGFVGSLDGVMCQTGYGVYWPAVAKAANHWRPAEAFSGWSLEQLVAELSQNNPVVVWGVLPVAKVNDCSWYTAQGKYIKALREDHVRLAVGFLGDKENPTHIILQDPLQGALYWPTKDFLTNWNFFGNSGVVVR